VLAICGFLVVCVALVSTSAHQAGLRLGEARQLEVNGDLAGANAIYEELLADDPRMVDAARGLGLNLALLGRFDDALPYQQKVVQLDPRDSQTWIELAFNYLNHQSEPERGLRAMDEGARLDRSPKNRTFLAQALLLNDKTSSAKAELEAVITEHPDYSYAQVVLARQLQRAGRLEEAAAARSGARGTEAEGGHASGETRGL